MEKLVSRLAQQAQQHYYGKYRGFVVNNQDPEKSGRLQLRVPSLFGGEPTGWALPCLPFGGLKNQGLFFIPEVDSQVWVEFEEGNVNQPIWVGVFWQESGDIPQEAAQKEPTTRVIRTPSGHVLQFDDAKGKEQFRLVHPAGSEMNIDPNGTVKVTDAAGSKLTLDAKTNKIKLEDSNGNTLTMDSAGTKVQDCNGNSIKMAGGQITVQGTKIVIQGGNVALGGEGGEHLLKAESFLALFNTHTHQTNITGVFTMPPDQQGVSAALGTTPTTAI